MRLHWIYKGFIRGNLFASIHVCVLNDVARHWYFALPNGKFIMSTRDRCRPNVGSRALPIAHANAWAATVTEKCQTHRMCTA